jgi:CMP-N-acetylneuraminic acid synthetase
MSALRQCRSLITSRTVAMVMPEYVVHDIDNEDDWTNAELNFQWLRVSGLSEAGAK